ncbi:MAG: hypothetical protein IPH09_16755 [bacterium]|nr:hypothetical protein [bacterium]
MPRMKSKPAVASTAAKRKQLARTQIQFKNLESRLAVLDKEYAALQAATGKLVAGLLGSAAAKAKATAPKTTRTPKVQVGKKAAIAKAKPGRKPKVQVAAKRGRPAAPKAPRQTVESTVVALLKANKKPMAFPEIMATIQKKKLIKTKSANFANVLRRTISTSSKIKRVGRGVYRA